MVNITVDASKCTACGTCRDICPAGVFVVRAKAVPENLADCMECHACEYQCTAGAIAFSDEPAAKPVKKKAKSKKK